MPERIESDESGSDEALAAQLAAGDAAAMRPLYARYARPIFGLAARALDTGAAEEVVQDVFLGLHRNAGSFDPSRGAFRAWIFEAARRKIANELRRRGRKNAGDLFEDDIASDAPSPDDEAFSAYRRATIAAAIEALPGAQQQALRLAFLEELTHEEVAAMLRVPVGTAKTRIRAGLKRLGVTLSPFLAMLLLVVIAVILKDDRDEREARDRQARALRMVTASDAELTRMTAAPGVDPKTHGTLRRRPGVGLVVVTLSNVARVEGKRYAVWATIDGATRALGAAQPGLDGKAILVAEDAALVDAPTSIEVTLEPDSGGPKSGPLVMRWAP